MLWQGWPSKITHRTITRIPSLMNVSTLWLAFFSWRFFFSFFVSVSAMMTVLHTDPGKIISARFQSSDLQCLSLGLSDSLDLSWVHLKSFPRLNWGRGILTQWLHFVVIESETIVHFCTVNSQLMVLIYIGFTGFCLWFSTGYTVKIYFTLIDNYLWSFACILNSFIKLLWSQSEE